MTAMFFLCLLSSVAVAQQKMEIRFTAKAGSSDLQLGNNYQDPWGETFTVYKFKFYIHNIQLADSSKKFVTVDKAHYLIDVADEAGSAIRLNKLPYKHIAYIRFTVGVDSVMNTSGVQTGVLDPLKGMFWTWNTGYIYAKLEGKSNASKMPGNNFSYDVGGYKAGENALRIVTLPVQGQIQVNVVADILKWFDGNSKIAIATQAICHEPGKLALLLADNYVNMFTIASNTDQ